MSLGQLFLFVALAASHAGETTASSPPTAGEGPSGDKGDYRLAPTFGLSFGQTHEAIRLEHADGDPTTDTRGLWNTRLELGFNYALNRRPKRLRIRGQSSVGVGLTFATGDWPVHVRQTFGVEYVPKPWFGLLATAGVGFDIATTRPVYSAFVVTLPIGLRFGPVELLYQPAIRVGLASEQSQVLGVLERRAAHTGFAPFELMLRIRIPIRGLR